MKEYLKEYRKNEIQQCVEENKKNHELKRAKVDVVTKINKEEVESSSNDDVNDVDVDIDDDDDNDDDKQDRIIRIR